MPRAPGVAQRGARGRSPPRRRDSIIADPAHSPSRKMSPPGTMAAKKIVLESFHILAAERAQPRQVEQRDAAIAAAHEALGFQAPQLRVRSRAARSEHAREIGL